MKSFNKFDIIFDDVNDIQFFENKDHKGQDLDKQSIEDEKFGILEC